MVPVPMKGLWVVMVTLAFLSHPQSMSPPCSGLSLALLHSWPDGQREGFAQGSLLELSILLPPSATTSRSDGGLCHSGRVPLVVDMTWAF